MAKNKNTSNDIDSDEATEQLKSGSKFNDL